jgi:hypothetical protein
MFSMFERRRKGLIAVAVAAPLWLPAAAEAESGAPIGDAIKVVNTVTADFDKAQRKLATGDGVRQDEVIQVDKDSLGELKLKDETKLALGPGAKLVLDKFVYDSDAKSGSIVMNLAKGAFRFMTGVASKPTYLIKTPTASITVRGTVFDVFVQDDGLTWLLLHEGAIEACNERGECKLHDQPGKLIRITPTGAVGIPINWDGLPGKSSVPFDTAFPFVGTPVEIDPKPVFTREAILNLDTPPVGKPKKAGNNDDDSTPPPPKKRKVVTKDDGDDEPVVRVKPKRKVVVKDNDDDEDTPKRIKTARRKHSDDDDWGNGVRAMDIVIGGGIRIGGGGHRQGGGNDMPTHMPKGVGR